MSDDQIAVLASLLGRVATGTDPETLQSEADAAGCGGRFAAATARRPSTASERAAFDAADLARRPATTNVSIRDRLRYSAARHHLATASLDVSRTTKKEINR